MILFSVTHLRQQKPSTKEFEIEKVFLFFFTKKAFRRLSQTLQPFVKLKKKKIHHKKKKKIRKAHGAIIQKQSVAI